MVVVYADISLGFHGQIEKAMACEKVEHMIEKWNTRRDGR
jgi:hypothetical protein